MKRDAKNKTSEKQRETEKAQGVAALPRKRRSLLQVTSWECWDERQSVQLSGADSSALNPALEKIVDLDEMTPATL